jgi:hypothetical protein
MTKKLCLDRPNRRDFLRTGIIGGTGLVVAQFAAPKELRAQTNTWTGQVGASTDDAFEDSLGFVYLTDKTNTICHENSLGGFRFTDVTVPNSATITAASVSFYVDTPQDMLQHVGCGVYMQAADNALTFDATKKFRLARAKTQHCGGFNDDTTTTGWVSSTDISAAVQEVVNRQPVNGMGGWVSGNAMAVLTVAPAGDVGGVLTVRMWDYNNGGPPNYAAILTIQYS